MPVTEVLVMVIVFDWTGPYEEVINLIWFSPNWILLPPFYNSAFK
jgi:hypothetical protein